MCAFTSYKLYKEKKNWTDADLHCKSEGGQLASIHPKWEQEMAEKAAEGETYVWLGGRRIDNKWQWADNTTWSFENWLSDNPGYGLDGYLLMNYHGRWWDYSPNPISIPNFYFLCQGPTAALTESGLASIELNKEELAFFPFHVIFKSHAIHQAKLNTTSKEEKNLQASPSTGSSRTATAPW